MARKDWKNQTSKTQKEMGGKQFIKDEVQVSIGQWDFDSPPNNWQFNVSSPEEARKGYPSQRLGITKKQAISLLNKYMRTH